MYSLKDPHKGITDKIAGSFQTARNEKGVESTFRDAGGVEARKGKRKLS